MITQVPHELSSAYAAFRRERGPDDVLGARHRRFPDEPAFAINPDLSRAVRARDGTTAYLVPGEGVLAVIENGGGGVVRSTGRSSAPVSVAPAGCWSPA